MKNKPRTALRPTALTCRAGSHRSALTFDVLRRFTNRPVVDFRHPPNDYLVVQ
jgi:hypothetical protein